MKKHAFADTLKGLKLTSFDYGYFEFIVARPSELGEFQVGYAVDDEGNSLAGEGEGDWGASWVVFAQDFLSDPIFTDLAAPDAPVFRAMHGQGAWEPEEVAPSVGAFAKILRAAAVLAKGRETPVELESNPVTDEEKDEFRAVVVANGGSEEYWLGSFEDDEDDV